MKDLKKILLRFVLLAVILAIMNIVYKKTMFKSDIETHCDLYELVQSVHPECQILYIGESSNITTRNNDTDKRSIHEFLAGFYPDLIVDDITKPAAHADIYYKMLKAIPKDNKIETVIVTLNLRSFNSGWINSELETNLQENAVLIRPYPPLINRGMLSFKAYDNKTKEERLQDKLDSWKSAPLPVPKDFPHQNVTEWDQWMAKTGIKNSEGKRDQQMTVLACHYIKAYAFKIDTLKNPRIKDFDKIVRLAKKQNWNLVFNLLAENVDKAEFLLGNDLISIMDYNANLLVDYYTRQGVTVVNNYRNVRDEQFINQNWTTEHYAEKGRQKVAGTVADSLKKFYPEKYINAFNQKKHLFFNNFDSPNSWFSGSSNKSSDYAYSGKFSEFLNDKHQYSQALWYYPEENEFSDDFTIHISAKVLSENKKNQGACVIEARKNNEIIGWYSQKTSETIEKDAQWRVFSMQKEFSQEMISADEIKVFFMTDRHSELYIDDFRIEFCRE